MPTRLTRQCTCLAAIGLLVGTAITQAFAQATRPIEYMVWFPDLSSHVAAVTARIPTDGKPSIELMMATWSPGYYKVENYADNVSGVMAKTLTGIPLTVDQPARNRWRIATGGAGDVVLTYRVKADRSFVTADWVGDSLIVLCGAPTFMTLVGASRPADVHLQLPRGWQSATSLDSVRAERRLGTRSSLTDSVDVYYRAHDYDELADSPIVAGDLRIRTFTAGDSPHAVVDIGQLGGWDSDRAARDLARIAAQDARFWGGKLPFPRYVFLNVFRSGGGGLEHKNSTLLTSSAAGGSTPAGYTRWLNFVSHEYFHAMNVKRLRPVELGPFDYEAAAYTPSLWISEGLTTYFGNLMVARAGIANDSAFLASMSSLIGQLQATPGRLVQTLSASSLDAWNSENSGVGMDQAKTVSYYTKGTVVGFLLDAHIRHLTNGRRSLDDVMRRAYAPYGGARGFRPDEFQRVASDVAGADLTAWFHRALDTTEELDYPEVLAWYGLQFNEGATDARARWRLTVRADATVEQRAHLARLVNER